MVSVQPKSRRVRFWRKSLDLVAVLVATYVVIVIVLLFFEDRFVFHPSAPDDRWRDPPPDCKFQDVALPTASGHSIHARWFPCREACGAALFCHSQNANLSICWPAESVPQWHRETG